MVHEMASQKKMQYLNLHNKRVQKINAWFFLVCFRFLKKKQLINVCIKLNNSKSVQEW